MTPCTVRILNVIDEANRECLTIEIGTSIPSARLIRVLNRLTATAHPMPYGWTMGRNWSCRCSPNGQRPKASPSDISSQASQTRMPLSSALIGLVALRCSMRIFFPILNRFKPSLTSGWLIITNTDRMKRWATSRRCSSCPG